MRSIGNILRDNIWEFVSVLVGALAIFAAYNIFFLERDVKKLQVTILASTSLVEVEQSILNDIEMLYKGQPIANLTLVQVRVDNSGNEVIREEDYARPVRFSFPPQAEIVEAAILESSPPNIGMTVQTDQNTATLSPVLLNEEDRVIIRFLLVNMPTNGDAQPFEVDARIAGVKDISVVGAIEGSETVTSWVVWIIGGVIASVLSSVFIFGMRELAPEPLKALFSRKEDS
jgi:hypothetical protein